MTCKHKCCFVFGLETFLSDSQLWYLHWQAVAHIYFCPLHNHNNMCIPTKPLSITITVILHNSLIIYTILTTYNVHTSLSRQSVGLQNVIDTSFHLGSIMLGSLSHLVPGVTWLFSHPHMMANIQQWTADVDITI